MKLKFIQLSNKDCRISDCLSPSTKTDKKQLPTPPPARARTQTHNHTLTFNQPQYCFAGEELVNHMIDHTQTPGKNTCWNQ